MSLINSILRLSVSFALLNFACGTSAKFARNENILFPSEDTNANRTATHQNRKPVTDNSRCGENELLYPGDISADWVCDCRPAYVYYPQKHQCYPAYRQGPCNVNEILVIGSNSPGVPICVTNECYPGYVKFENQCRELNKEPGCEKYAELTGRKIVVSVDPTTLKLTCLDESEQLKCENNCCKGGIRAAIGKCTL